MNFKAAVVSVKTLQSYHSVTIIVSPSSCSNAISISDQIIAKRLIVHSLLSFSVRTTYIQFVEITMYSIISQQAQTVKRATGGE